LLALLGLSLLQGVAAQHVPGYPNTGQLRYYLYVPVGISLALLAISFISLRFRVGGALAIIPALAILAVLPFMMVYSGGI
jgi:hypothetical protein